MTKKFTFNSLFIFFLGVFSSFSLPPYNFLFINFFTFSFFFIFLFKNRNNRFEKKIFFYYGWLFGFGYFLTNIYWITISLTFDKNFNFLIPLALTLIPALLAIFYGLISLIFYLFNSKNVISAFFLFSLLFGFIEFIRGNILTGFPWNLIVYSFSENLIFLSLLSVFGTYSLNLIVVSLFLVPSVYILRKSKKELFICFAAVLFAISSYFYGLFYKEKYLKNEIKENSFTIRVLGSNIGLNRFYDNSQTETVIKELIELSEPDKDLKIFFLWPEGIIPNIYLEELDSYKNIFINNFSKNHLIGIGTTSRSVIKSNYKYFNSLSIFDNNLNLIENYNKVNLVPFGEFLPFENFLNKIGLKTIASNVGSFSKGNKRNIITFKSDDDEIKFLPLICYEIIYSGKLTSNFNFDFIVNISEDGWFGKSIGPEQHFSHSIFRAIETGKYVIRSSNNGKAAIINPLGEIEKKIDFGDNGFIDFRKRRDIDATYFSKYGNKIFVLLILLYIFLFFSFKDQK